MFCSNPREQRSSPDHAAQNSATLPTTPGEEVRRPLRIRGRPDYVGRRTIADMPEPAGDVGRLLLSHRHVGAGHGAEES